MEPLCVLIVLNQAVKERQMIVGKLALMVVTIKSNPRLSKSLQRLKAIYDDKRYDRPNAHTLILFLFNNIDSLVKEMLGNAIVKEMPTDSE